MILQNDSREVKKLIDLYNLGELNKAELKTRELLKKYPDAFILYNISSLQYEPSCKHRWNSRVCI